MPLRLKWSRGDIVNDTQTYINIYTTYTHKHMYVYRCDIYIYYICMHINPFVDINIYIYIYIYILLYCMQSRALFQNIFQFCTFLPRFFNLILITHFILYIYIICIYIIYKLYIKCVWNVSYDHEVSLKLVLAPTAEIYH